MITVFVGSIICTVAQNFINLASVVYWVLLCYLSADFEQAKKQKGGPLEIEIFFAEGG